MKSGTLKLVKMQLANAPSPMLSMPLWRRMGHRREPVKAWLRILLSESGMINFLIERSHQAKERSPISTRPSHSSTSDNLLRWLNALVGIDVTEG